MRKPRQRGLGSSLAAILRTIHPARATYEVCCTVLFAIPFLAAFAATRLHSLSLYLLFPLLFLAVHLAWFHVPAFNARLRWILLWLALTIVFALGAGFIVSVYRDAGAQAPGLVQAGVSAIPRWASPAPDTPFAAVAVYALAPAAAATALYCLIFSLFLRIYRTWRADEKQRRSSGNGSGRRGPWF